MRVYQFHHSGTFGKKVYISCAAGLQALAMGGAKKNPGHGRGSVVRAFLG